MIKILVKAHVAIVLLCLTTLAWGQVGPERDVDCAKIEKCNDSDGFYCYCLYKTYGDHPYSCIFSGGTGTGTGTDVEPCCCDENGHYSDSDACKAAQECINNICPYSEPTNCCFQANSEICRTRPNP